MRILLVSQYFYPAWHYGGPVTKVKGLADGLADLGHSVTVLTSAISKSEYSGEPLDGRGELRQLGKLSVFYLRSIFSYRGVSVNPGALRFCRHHLQDYDIVHIFGLYDTLGWVAGSYARRKGVPYVIEPLGMYASDLPHFCKKRLYHLLIGEEMLRRAEVVVATSDSEHAHLLRVPGISPNRIIVRGNGVEIEAADAAGLKGGFRSRAGFQESDKLILFLGRIAPIKDLELLVQSFAGLGIPGAHLLLVGPTVDAGYLSRLKQLIDTLGVGDRVHFYDTVYGAAKWELFAAADVLVLCSHSESFGNVVAEAVVAGVPVVVTEGCGIAPQVRDRAGLVSGHSVREVRESLLRLLTDDDLYRRFRLNCAVVGREFAWGEPLAIMDRIYREVLERRRGTGASTETSLP